MKKNITNILTNIKDPQPTMTRLEEKLNKQKRFNEIMIGQIKAMLRRIK